MSSFEREPPKLSIVELEALAATRFGVDGTAMLLQSERDQNARIDAHGRRYVLKIVNAAEDPGVIEMQNAVLDHLEAVGVTGFPKLATTLDGETLTRFGPSMVRMVRYLEGRTLGSVMKTVPLLRSLGEFMGVLTHGLQGFGQPHAHRLDFLWNLDNALGCLAYAKDIADPGQRALAESIFLRYRNEVRPKLQRLRSSVLHQDANDHNAIVDERAGRASGLIEFGDMVFGFRWRSA